MTVELIHGDCLEVMPNLQKVDAVICDPPYGTTACKWDGVIPLEDMWRCLGLVSKETAPIILMGSQPFSSVLVASNLPMFKHEWVWIKNRGSNFANTVREPMKEHEVVLVFSKGGWTYNKQMQERTGGGLDRVQYGFTDVGQEREGTRKFEGRSVDSMPDMRVPSSWQKFNIASGNEKTKHPTQKPVALMEYLIRTYTNEGDTVLDFTMGSGTTGVACINTKRNFIGIEKDETYFNIAKERIENTQTVLI